MDSDIIGLCLGFAIGLVLMALIVGSDGIYADELRYAQSMCGPNDGIKWISHFEIRCSNGAAFDWQ